MRLAPPNVNGFKIPQGNARLLMHENSATLGADCGEGSNPMDFRVTRNGSGSQAKP